jgi:hypothetical protein
MPRNFTQPRSSLFMGTDVSGGRSLLPASIAGLPRHCSSRIDEMMSLAAELNVLGEWAEI